MRFLVLGATGMVGQAIAAEAGSRGHLVTAGARRGAPLLIDATDDSALRRAVDEVRPEVVVNCLSYGSVEACNENPGAAYRVNARVNGRLAELCRGVDATLVAIGTDHYFTGDGVKRHDESAEVRLVNDYALSKYAGEQLALAWPRSLAIRTNVTGFRGWADRPTFVEWAVSSLRSGVPAELFDDYHCSTIDAGSLARAVVELVERGARGLFNVASRDVVSKRQFVIGLAERLSLPSGHLRTGSVRALAVPRAESAGLDVGKAEAAIGRRLPSFDQVIDRLARLAEDV